jgi:hypothetical protein
VRRTSLVCLVLVPLLTAACSSNSTLSIPAAQRAVDRWQSVVDQDQTQLGTDEGCPPGSQTASPVPECTPEPNGCPITSGTVLIDCIPQSQQSQQLANVRRDDAKINAAQFQLRIAQDELKKAEN